MPVPNEFNRKLPEVFGQEAANQMTDWMNEREAEISDFRSEVRADFAEVRHQFELVKSRFEAIDARLEAMDHRFETIDQRFGSLEKSIEKTIDAKLAAATATQLKWAVAMWIATMAFLGAMIRLPR